MIGVAVFTERPRPQRRRSKPVQPYAPYVEPGVDYGGSTGEAFPESDGRPETSGARSGAFAPSPVPLNKVGTAYGESRTSVVHTTRFRRRRGRRPDSMMTIYYDSREGLQARGVLPGWDDDGYRAPRPFPGPYTAPPPAVVPSPSHSARRAR